MKSWLKTLLLALVLQAPIAHSAAAGPSPEGTIETLNAALLAAMSEPDSGYATRFEKLEPLMSEAFDYDYMAEVAAGKYWKDLDEAERQRYLDLFAEVSIAAAANRFRERPGVEFSVTGQREGPQGTQLVETLLKVPGKESHRIDYLMRETTPGDWRAVDLYYDGTISELATKRSEYTAVIKREGIDKLFAILEGKLVDYAKDKS